jgi:hypothetical protein
MKIHIFYRQYNILGNQKGRPKFFDFEKCFVNLLNTIEGENVDLHVVMDGRPETNFVHKYKDKVTKFHQIEAGEDQVSFFKTWEIAKNIKTNKNDLIYFLENDYIHIEGWVNKVLELFSSYNLPHYVSLYDNKDKYILPMYDDLVSKIFLTENHHWRTTASACGSFIVNKELFNLDYDINTSVAGDHNKFMLLNEQRGRMVITPIPGLSTHCVEGLMSPTINWEKYV